MGRTREEVLVRSHYIPFFNEQILLRHANLKVTMDTYVQAVTDEKREAQSKVVEMLLPGVRKAAV